MKSKIGAVASQITSLTIVYSTVYSDADQRKHQSSASLAFVWGIHRGPVNSPHKWPVTRKMFPFDDVIMNTPCCIVLHLMLVYWSRACVIAHSSDIVLVGQWYFTRHVITYPCWDQSLTMSVRGAGTSKGHLSSISRLREIATDMGEWFPISANDFRHQ